MTDHVPPNRRAGLAIACVVLAMPALALSTLVMPALAAPPRGAQMAIPHSAYPDGTGDSLIDRLNAAQLAPNYRGPVYYPGQPAPPAQPLNPQDLPPNVPQVVPPPPPGMGAPQPSMQPLMRAPMGAPMRAPMGPSAPPCAAGQLC